MDIFVKYPDSDALHHFRTGDGEDSEDHAKFRATVLSGRRDLILTDSAGNVLDGPTAVPEPVIVPEPPPVIEEPVVVAEDPIPEPIVDEPVLVVEEEPAE